MDPSAALTALMSAMKQLGLVQQKAGQMTHSMDAMLLAASAQSVGLKTAFEVGKGSARELDLQVKRVGTVVANVETKSTQAKRIMAELNPAQLLQDARKVQQAGEDFINVWAFTRRSFSVANIGEIERRMEGLQDKIRADIAKTTGKTGAELQQAVETTMKSFHFVDKVGKLIQLEFDDGKLRAVVKPVSDHLLGPDGTFAQVLLAGAQGSPNLKPMAEALLGPNGKFAMAAHEAATGANLNTAEKDLENKLSKTLSEGIENGATKGSQEASKKLHEKISGGANELANILTSIPNLVGSVKTLGEAWDKPNKGLDDYMAVMSGLGGVVGNIGGVIQAFAGAQQLATAAQAAFNFVAAMNPYVLLAIAVVALIAGIVLLIVYWDKVKAAIRDNPWIAVIAVMFGVIGVIVLVIAYWDEIKLAVLKAANFVSIQLQRIGGFFIGVKNLAGMVWDWIIATLENAGISILNAFITIGVGIENFFIGIVNFVLEKYNDLAGSVVGDVLGLSKAELIPEVDVKTKLIPPKEVPKVDVEAAFKPMTEDKTGGLEGQIAKQQGVVDKAHKEDEERRAKAAKEKADKEKAAAAGKPEGAPGAPAVPGMPTLPAGAPGAPPAIPGAPGVPVPAAAAPTGGGGVTVQGGITVTINADKLEANAAQMLSDEIVRGLNERLQALQGDANRRMGAAAA